jgi:hypothetical protein
MSADGRVATVAARRENNFVEPKNGRTHLTPTGLLMEGDSAQKPSQFISPNGCITQTVCRSSILRHGRPSPWANTESSRITVAECFGFQIWIIANWRCSTASAHPPRDACTNTPSTIVVQAEEVALCQGLKFGREHHQPATRCRAPASTRGRRLGLAESRVGCGDQPSERSQATRVSLW